MKSLAAGGAIALAGCVGGDDDDDEETDDTDAGDGNGDDENGDEETELLSTDPAPEGEALSEDDLDALIDLFDDEPFTGGQDTPAHRWKVVSDDTLIFLHFNDPEPREADGLAYIGVGKKGVYAAGARPDEEFTHFHQYDHDDWGEAHHGAPDAEAGENGWWLTHIAVGPDPEPGVDYEFNPTEEDDLPEADGDHEADFTVDGEGSLTDDEISEFIGIFDDQPFNDDQQETPTGTPSHRWKWISEDVMMFTHWDEPNVEEANDLLYFGLGVRSQFTDSDRPHAEDFTHWHQWEAEDWGAGHHGDDSDQWGYWLLHHSVRPLNLGFHDEEIGVGVDRDFFVTEDVPE